MLIVAAARALFSPLVSSSSERRGQLSSTLGKRSESAACIVVLESETQGGPNRYATFAVNSLSYGSEQNSSLTFPKLPEFGVVGLSALNPTTFVWNIFF